MIIHDRIDRAVGRCPESLRRWTFTASSIPSSATKSVDPHAPDLCVWTARESGKPHEQESRNESDERLRKTCILLWTPPVLQLFRIVARQPAIAARRRCGRLTGKLKLRLGARWRNIRPSSQLAVWSPVPSVCL